MISRLFLLSCLVLATNGARAVEFSLKTNFVAGVPSNSYVLVAARSAGGAIYTTGFSFDPILGNTAPVSIITTKYHRRGRALWTNVLHNFPAPVTQDVVVDRSGDILVLASTWDRPAETSATSLRKMAPNGRVLWSKMLPDGDADYLHLMNDGSVLIPTGSNSVVRLNRHGDGVWTNHFGSRSVTGVGSDRRGQAFVAALGDDQIVIGKFDRKGSLLWSNALPSFAERGSMAVDRRGNLYVALAGGLLMKFAPTGIASWTNELATPDGVVDSPTDVAVDPRGDVYVTGWNFNSPTKHLVSAKVTSSGELVWLQAQPFTVGGGDYTSAPRLTRVHCRSTTVVQHDKLFDGQGSYTFTTQTFHYRESAFP